MQPVSFIVSSILNYSLAKRVNRIANCWTMSGEPVLQTRRQLLWALLERVCQYSIALSVHLYSFILFCFFFFLITLFDSFLINTGKTSLLNILSGRASSGGRITISSDMRLDNYVVDPTNIKVRQMIAFVAQDDSLQVTSTPREAIYFSAKLRLPRSTTEHQLDSLTHRMLHELNLKDCADTIVGGELIKGISGGQRKRTSVGVELVTKPALVFLGK